MAGLQQAELVEIAVDEYVERHREEFGRRMERARAALLGVSTLAYASGVAEEDGARVGGVSGPQSGSRKPRRATSNQAESRTAIEAIARRLGERSVSQTPEGSGTLGRRFATLVPPSARSAQGEAIKYERELSDRGPNVMARMHNDELEIDEALVRRLLAGQFPEWVHLPLRRIEPAGTVNAIFRLGDELSARLPRLRGPTEPGSTEFDWLPKLAPLLPIEVPVPVAQGHPSDDYPWFWEIHTWVDGETVPVKEIDAIEAARDLAALVEAMQQVSPAGAPRGRGIPLAERDHETRYWLARFDGDPTVTAEWERALAAPSWDGPPVWHHGDLDVRNWLVRDRRISGVIDWGAMGVGDPACDVMVAWKLHSPAARDAFRAALPTDDATWGRARGWVLSQAIAILAYYTPENNPALFHEAESWLALVLSERD